MRTIAGRDDGAARLGEIALVDREGRIGALDTSSTTRCSTRTPPATSRSAPASRSWSPTRTDRERINDSQIHIDFMIGSEDVAVTGLTRDGERVPVLRGGGWQL